VLAVSNAARCLAIWFALVVWWAVHDSRKLRHDVNLDKHHHLPLISICGLPCTSQSIHAQYDYDYQAQFSSNKPEYHSNLFTFLSITMSGRAVPALGALAAGGIGYYLYTAGGDPKLAEKKAERMLSFNTRQVT
jgi:hypothetical protein